MEKWKKTLIQAVICVVLLCLIWGGYLVGKYRIEDTKNRQIILYEDDFSWEYQIDEVRITDGDLLLTGFAFELDKDAVGDNFEIVLQEIGTENNYFLKMKYAERTDVNKYFLCEYDYLHSGFTAKIKAKKLDLQKKEYEVILRKSGEKTAYRTGTYIVDGELMYTNPKEFVPLQVEGTDLEEVVKNGKLRVYRPDYGMYVYQYEGELYWIAEQTYAFDENDDVNIQYHLDTTQVGKLPETRKENGYYWDNIGFYFRGRELTDCDAGIYRVAKRELPTEYAVEKIWTGNHDGEWIWKEYFRPYYVFEN